MFARKHPLEIQAHEIADQLRAKLTRMGMRHRVKRRDYDDLY